MPNKTTYLKDYKVSSFLVESLDLTFELEKDYTLVTSKALYFKNTNSLDNNTLILNWVNLELISIFLDKKELTLNKIEIRDNLLSLTNLPDKFNLKIITKIYPKTNTSLGWLYISNNIYCTQCEPQWFRNMTYYLDRPDVMTVFTTKIIANKATNPVLLSNWNLVQSWNLRDWRHFALWEDPFKKPSYLFALVAWSLDNIEDKYITTSWKEVTLKIFTKKNNLNKTTFAMGALKRAMKWDEDKFWLEYDLGLFMIVAIDDFNSWAMENKWLNIFNSAVLFATPESTTDKDYIYIERVIWHEYFHNWTGDRVTCRDWFQLSLKEGLTVFRDSEFTADMHSRTVKRIEDVRNLRNFQFREDSTPMSHPIRPSNFEEISNFYTMTVYEKWSEVVRIYQTILWVSAFRRWMDLYFDRHDWEAVTTEDFLLSMKDANTDKLEELWINLLQMQNWYEQPWTPIVNVVSNYNIEKKEYSINLKQHCIDWTGVKQDRPFLIPIKFWLLDKQWNDICLENDTILLTKSEESFIFKGIKSKPIPSLLRDFSAPIKLNYNYTFEEYLFLVKNDNDEFNRFDAIQNFAMENLLNIISSWIYEVDHNFKKAFRFILLDDSITSSFKAESISLPSEILIADTIEKNINYTIIHKAREYFVATLAKEFLTEIRSLYNKVNITKPYLVESSDIWDRKLKNIVLEYISIIKWPEIAYQSYLNSNNMTDTFSALSIISNTDSPKRQEILDDFYEKWKNDPITLDKWFSVQAKSNLPDTLKNVKKLSNHKLFDITNPNKVRALYNSFSMLNPTVFNNKDSYRFIADKVIELDKINPDIASRLVKSMINWKVLERELWEKLKFELIRISNMPWLSPWVSEVVTKSL